MSASTSDTNDASTSRPPRLLGAARDAIRQRQYSYRTEQAYLRRMKRFVISSGKRHLDLLRAPES